MKVNLEIFIAFNNLQGMGTNVGGMPRLIALTRRQELHDSGFAAADFKAASGAGCYQTVEKTLQVGRRAVHEDDVVGIAESRQQAGNAAGRCQRHFGTHQAPAAEASSPRYRCQSQSGWG